QRLCQAVATDPNPKSKRPEGTRNPKSVDQQCAALFLSAAARERDANLLFVRERLLREEADRVSLLDLYGQGRAGKRVPAEENNPLVDLLRLSGIVRTESSRGAGSTCLRVRNRIYERVFDRAWITQQMPDAELLRQQAAYRRGIVRATAVYGAFLLVIGALA